MKTQNFKESDVEVQDISGWMDDVKVGGADLPDCKGKVVAIQPPVDIETKFGKRKKCQIVIEGSDASVVNVSLFLPEQFPMVHPKSNLAKILQHYGCTGLRELIGKEVEVVSVGDMLWKFKFE